MGLYAIGDLHLSLGGDKTMEVFGGAWINYVEKIADGFSALSDDDVTVLCGDITWGMTIEEALPDFEFIDSLPGKKIIIKGNHDYWWTTANKARTFFAEHDIKSIDVMHNTSFEYEGVSLCGTRGWFYEECRGDAHDKKIMTREVGRLETSLKCAKSDEIFVFLHYPPKFQSYECPEILDLLRRYNVARCCYGHLHGDSCRGAFSGLLGGTKFDIVSADHLNFKPMRLI